jgi:hypothetical protein
MSVEVQDYFDVKYGVNLELVNLEQKKDGINFVSRTAQNNGVSAKVKILKNKKPNPANTISVSCGGSVMESFLQKEEYYSGRDIYILIPKSKLSDKQLLYYCMCLKANKYRYNYGRQPNKTLKHIQIPSIKEIPKWVNEIKFPKVPTRKSILSEKIDLNLNHWRWFYINELFEIKKGERLVKEKRVSGKIPLITATSENNGVVDFISYTEFSKKKKSFENKITVDMFFNVFYHNYKYFSDDNVHTLIPKFKKSNLYISLFLVAVLKKLQYKYDYGRQLRLSRIDLDKIKLPVTKEKLPDWNLMEFYIKSLKYSQSI